MRQTVFKKAYICLLLFLQKKPIADWNKNINLTTVYILIEHNTYNSWTEAQKFPVIARKRKFPSYGPVWEMKELDDRDLKIVRTWMS